MYSKQFLISAFLSRYISLPADKFEALADMADTFFEARGRDAFRIYCSLDAAAVKQYKEWIAVKT